MDVVTYSLRDGGGDSGQYYRDVATFTDEVLARGADLYPVVDAFMSYVEEHGLENARSRDEYLFELLLLGTLWRQYGDDAHNLPSLPRKALVALSDMRKYGGSVKQAVDIARGLLMTAFLSPKDHARYPGPTPDHFNKLLDWMAATGDFQQEVKRLQAWKGFWQGCEPDSVCGDIQKAIDYATWFEEASVRALGKYTPNVDRFLSERQCGHRWKEDVIFSGRRRVEYHLGMVGAEVMNRAFRPDFLASKKKAVVLPACMRYLPESRCRAKAGGLALECTGCTPRCRVNQLTKMGRKLGFGVYLVPHESSVFTGDSGKKLLGEGAGIVGVACVSNLISGGWKAKALGLPPQCVLLDHCGCRKHWHERGIATDINMAQFRKVLGLDGMASPPKAVS